MQPPKQTLRTQNLIHKTEQAVQRTGALPTIAHLIRQLNALDRLLAGYQLSVPIGGLRAEEHPPAPSFDPMDHEREWRDAPASVPEFHEKSAADDSPVSTPRSAMSSDVDWASERRSKAGSASPAAIPAETTNDERFPRVSPSALGIKGTQRQPSRVHLVAAATEQTARQPASLPSTADTGTTPGANSTAEHDAPSAIDKSGIAPRFRGMRRSTTPVVRLERGDPPSQSADTDENAQDRHPRRQSAAAQQIAAAEPEVSTTRPPGQIMGLQPRSLQQQFRNQNGHAESKGAIRQIASPPHGSPLDRTAADVGSDGARSSQLPGFGTGADEPRESLLSDLDDEIEGHGAAEDALDQLADQIERLLRREARRYGIDL